MTTATKDLAKPTVVFDLAVRSTGAPTEGATVQGQDISGAVSRLTMYQGTAQEEQMYGNSFKRGEFLDALEKRRIGPAFSGKDAPRVKIVPIAGWTTWSRWAKGAKIPDYVFKDKAQVPKADLEWTENGATRTPPAATEAVNMVVLVEGEPWPFLFVFKRTGLNAYNKVIKPMEVRYGHSVYELTSADDKNAAGQAFKRLEARFVSKADEATLNAVRAIKAQLAAVMQRAEQIAAEENDAEIPV